MLKARNRFKSDYKIVDICDLGAALYGPGIKPFIQVILVATNSSFLMAYCMFLGFNSDQILCKSFQVAECHQQNLYTGIILLALFPVYCLRSMNNIGYFSAVALFFTFIAIVLILVICGGLIAMEPSEIRDEYHLNIKDEDREYNYFDGYMVPVVVATLNSLFEGN